MDSLGFGQSFVKKKMNNLCVYFDFEKSKKSKSFWNFWQNLKY